MTITPISFYAKKVSFDKGTQKSNVEFTKGDLFSDKKPKAFGIRFDISIKINDSLLKVQYFGDFLYEKDIDDEFKNSNFMSINAPAITYPYLRAFVTQFLSLVGVDPVILPAVNFVNLEKQKKKIQKKKMQKIKNKKV